jgi:hypothetical protein
MDHALEIEFHQHFSFHLSLPGCFVFLQCVSMRRFRAHIFGILKFDRTGLW